MERSKIIKRCVSFYEEIRSKHEDLILFFILTLFVYFRDKSSGQLSLGGRMNSIIRCEALEDLKRMVMLLYVFKAFCLLRPHQLKRIILTPHEKGLRYSLFDYSCLGALDDTYIEVTIPESEKSRYRTKKNKICTNILRMCNQEMKFVYVLSKWQRSASDIRHLSFCSSEVAHGFITEAQELKGAQQNYIYFIDIHQGIEEGPLRDKHPRQETQLRDGGDGGSANPEARKPQQRQDRRRLQDAIVNCWRPTRCRRSVFLGVSAGDGKDRRIWGEETRRGLEWVRATFLKN
ncbi:hypothetical protein Ahy_B09g098910 [Arachis hypogaea]|uniref:DDE Tnp4 domain-containing protein n=1 Tax=Arachis hypogaea TaxID=3818 RepID=A0A444XSF1_ARAHY|nr:hypothetical protein Ahy_B09g098910 [Arachis hypogaea]